MEEITYSQLSCSGFQPISWESSWLGKFEMCYTWKEKFVSFKHLDLLGSPSELCMLMEKFVRNSFHMWLTGCMVCLWYLCQISLGNEYKKIRIGSDSLKIKLAKTNKAYLTWYTSVFSVFTSLSFYLLESRSHQKQIYFLSSPLTAELKTLVLWVYSLDSTILAILLK